MSDDKDHLILHLASGGEPLVFALSPKSAKSLQKRLPVLLSSGGVEEPELANGDTFAVNFAHVVTAHFDRLPLPPVYGGK